MGVHHSVVSRELSRNITKRGRTAGKYVAQIYQCKTDQRYKLKPKSVKFTEPKNEQDAKWHTSDK
jgi:hypothetical protein